MPEVDKILEIQSLLTKAQGLTIDVCDMQYNPDELISRSELLQAIKEACQNINVLNCVDVFRIITIIQSIHHIDTSPVSRWRKVCEEKPNHGQKCIIYTKVHFTPGHVDELDYAYGIELTTYSKHGGFLSSNGLYAEYWMPAPKPPKVSKRED